MAVRGDSSGGCFVAAAEGRWCAFRDVAGLGPGWQFKLTDGFASALRRKFRLDPQHRADAGP